MRARVDVHGAGAHDELGGLVELRGVEQLLRFGQSGLVEPLHAFHHLRRGGGGIEGKVDVHVAPVARLGRQTDEFDFEVFESLEAEFFAKAVHARDRNVGARGKFLNGKPAHILAHGEGRLPKLLLGGGEAFALRDLSPDIHMAPMRLRRDKPIITINKTFGLAGSFGPPVYERRTARRRAGSTWGHCPCWAVCARGVTRAHVRAPRGRWARRARSCRICRGRRDRGC